MNKLSAEQRLQLAAAMGLGILPTAGVVGNLMLAIVAGVNLSGGNPLHEVWIFLGYMCFLLIGILGIALSWGWTDGNGKNGMIAVHILVGVASIFTFIGNMYYLTVVLPILFSICSAGILAAVFQGMVTPQSEEVETGDRVRDTQ